MAKAKRSAAQKAATKRMLEAAAARRAGGTGPAKRKKGAKKYGSKSSKSLARSEAAKLGHAHHGYKLAAPPKGASTAKRLATLEKNVAMVAHGLGVVADEVMQHRKALLGAGLLSARGSAGKAR